MCRRCVRERERKICDPNNDNVNNLIFGRENVWQIFSSCAWIFWQMPSLAFYRTPSHKEWIWPSEFPQSIIFDSHVYTFQIGLHINCRMSNIRRCLCAFAQRCHRFHSDNKCQYKHTFHKHKHEFANKNRFNLIQRDFKAFQPLECHLRMK